MKNKYYTPEIEEFHVGFEYEVNALEGTWDNGKEERNWVKTSIDDNIHQLFAETKRLKDEPENIRVKYLDKEDIESLGLPSYIVINHILNNTYEIIGTNARIFRGDIKNKSELKRLLKQLNIK